MSCSAAASSGPTTSQLTAALLAAFALSVPFDSLTYPLARALYATHNTLLQVIASIAAFVTIVVVSPGLAPALGILSIPLGYAAGSGVKVGPAGGLPRSGDCERSNANGGSKRPRRRSPDAGSADRSVRGASGRG